MERKIVGIKISLPELKELDEGGKAPIIAIAGIAFLFYYATTGYQTFSKYMAPLQHLGLASVIALVTLGCLAYTVYCLFLGSKNPARMKNVALNKAEETFKIVCDANKRIADIDQKMLRKMLCASVEGIRKLGMLKRIVRAMEYRLEEVNQLLGSWHPSGAKGAYELMTSANLEINDSAFDWVMDAENIPPLTPDAFPAEVERLLQIIDTEIKQMAA